MQVIWDISPVMIKIGFFDLRYYSLFFAIGIFLAYLVFVKLISGYSQKQVDNLFVFVVLGTLIGARLGHCLFYDFSYYSKHILEIFLPFAFVKNKFVFTGYQGLASHGGAIGIFVAILIFCKTYKRNVLNVLDRVCIVAPIAGGFIRLGNLMNSEIIGKATNSDMGFIFKMIDDTPRHPTQLYEAVGYFLIFFMLQTIYKKTDFIKFKGKIFGLFLILVFVFRFFIEFLKENQSAFESGMIFNMGQILSLPFILFGVLLVFREKYINIRNLL